MELVNEADTGEMPLFTGNEVVDKNIWDEKQHLDIIKHYSQDELNPEALQKRQWSIFGKSFINTFLEEQDLMILDIDFRILKTQELMSKPAHLITFQEVSELNKMALYMYLTAKRAIGFKNNKMNERILQNTQISQAIGTQTQTMNMPRKKIFGLI